MFKVRKTFKFEMAHILESSYSKECQQIHGHSYLMEVFLEAKTLNKDGMVIDFKRLKEIIGPIANDLDHKLITTGSTLSFREKSVVFPFNSTAENMAKWIAEISVERLKGECNISALTVRLHETATGWAEYRIEIK